MDRMSLQYGFYLLKLPILDQLSLRLLLLSWISHKALGILKPDDAVPNFQVPVSYHMAKTRFSNIVRNESYLF